MDLNPATPGYHAPTLLRIGVMGGAYVKVRVDAPLSPETLRDLRDKMPPPYAVLSGEPVGLRRYREHHRKGQFFRELLERGVEHVIASLADAQETYEVLGAAVALPLEEAIDLADRYGQPDLYWFDGTVFWYVPVPESVGPPVRLPGDAAERLRRLVREYGLDDVGDPGGAEGEEEGPPKLR